MLQIYFVSLFQSQDRFHLKLEPRVKARAINFTVAEKNEEKLKQVNTALSMPETEGQA